MQFIAQVQQSDKADLSMDWTPVNGSSFSHAAMTFLKKIFGEVAPLGSTWVAVADADGPAFDNGMPVIVHFFRLEWEKPLPS